MTVEEAGLKLEEIANDLKKPCVEYSPLDCCTDKLNIDPRFFDKFQFDKFSKAIDKIEDKVSNERIYEYCSSLIKLISQIKIMDKKI